VLQRVAASAEALSNGAIPKLNFLVSGRISVVMSTFSVFGLSYGRSGNEFCAEEGSNPIFDPLLFRATKNCVVICRASLLYEMGYPFRITLFVPMEFSNIFRRKLNETVT